MGQRWTYKNNSEITLIQGINPVEQPLEYLRMVNSPKNDFEMRAAFLDGNSIPSKKETELLHRADENRIAILLTHLLEFIEILREKTKEKEEMISGWRTQQLQEEEMRRQFATASDQGRLRQFDKPDISLIAGEKIVTKIIAAVTELKKMDERIQALEAKVQDLKKHDVVINTAWRETKREALEQQIKELADQNYILKVMVRDENGQALKQNRPVMDERGNIAKDKEGKEKFVSDYVFRDVKVSSEEGKRLLDVFGVMPSTASDKQDRKDRKAHKEEFTLTRRLDALLLSYDIAPDPLVKSRRETLAPLSPLDTQEKTNNEFVDDKPKKAPPVPPKLPPKPPQKSQQKPDRIVINMEEFYKREQLNDAFEVLFVKTRGGVRVEEKVMITSQEMLSLLNAEKGANKLLVKLQHKPSPATLQNLTQALQHAITKQDANNELTMEKDVFDKRMKEAGQLANEFVSRGYPGFDIMKAIKGTKAEQEQVITQMLDAYKQQSKSTPRPEKG